MNRPSRADSAGRAYLDLRAKARGDRRPVDELFQLYVLESFLARLVESDFADRFVLKGGVLMAAFGERRPTRDVDLHAKAVDNDAEVIRNAMCAVAGHHIDDGIVFDVSSSTARVIRDEEAYSGVRVTMAAQLATAHLHFHVDVNVGDPITPQPEDVHLPRLLGGEVVLKGYPLAMVHAEKIVTAIARGTVNTRWRDFADVYLLSRHHPVDGSELVGSIGRVANYRGMELTPLSGILEGYGEIGQARWLAWRRKLHLEDRVPSEFGAVVSPVVEFADPAITGSAGGMIWDPPDGTWG